MQHRIVTILIGITSILVTVGAMELGLRAAAKGNGLIAAWQTDQRFQLDSRLVYRLKPNTISSRQTGEYLETVTVNDQGLRSTMPTQERKEPDTYRILLIGDSFTFGHGLNDSQTIAAAMETQLNASQSGIRFEVLNHGTPGYSPDQEYQTLLEDIPKFQPDLIYWNLIPDDMDDTIRPGPNYRASLYTLAADGSLQARDATKNQIYIRNALLTRTPKAIRTTRIFTVLLNAFARLPLFLDIPNLPQKQLRLWAQEKMIQEAAQINNRCHTSHCLLVVSWFPAPLTESRRSAIPFPEKELNGRGIKTVNIARILGIRPADFYPLDNHPNPTGAASIAGVLSQHARDIFSDLTVNLSTRP